jgi:hypothetical protein
MEATVADIVVKKGSGKVKTKVEVLGGAHAVTSSTLWILDSRNPDRFEEVRRVKDATDAEGVLYEVGDDADLDDKFLEWMWTAAPAPGSNSRQGTVRITVQQGDHSVEGYPLNKAFDFSSNGPVTFSLTRHFRVTP